MTAVLSPAEQAEVSRFGVFDEEVFADLTTRWGDSLACDETGCGEPAEWLAKARCGCARLVLCGTHMEAARERIEAVFSRAAAISCKECGHRYYEASFNAVYEVVAL